MYALRGRECRSRSRGRALYREASRAYTCHISPLPSRGGDRELEEVRVMCPCENMRSTWNNLVLLGLASECSC